MSRDGFALVLVDKRKRVNAGFIAMWLNYLILPNYISPRYAEKQKIGLAGRFISELPVNGELQFCRPGPFTLLGEKNGSFPC